MCDPLSTRCSPTPLGGLAPHPPRSARESYRMAARIEADRDPQDDVEDQRAREADLALIAHYRSGTAGAAEALGRRLAVVACILKALNARLGRPLGPEQLADLAQDATAVVLRKLGEFDGRYDLDGWLYGICRFELLNRRRRLLRRGSHRAPADQLLALPAEEAEPAALGAIVEDIRAGLATLAEDEREVVQLKHFDGLTFEAAGERLGVAASTAKSKYYRGLAKLKAFLEPRRKEYLP